ncbi:helix-turn-helix domain-containing protein [Pedobacter sp. MC2016-14]|uniref:helix-turn-helix domain-containing protein n=1 Tax=Pedobacter sp. MC2016-14 TaxID=2897327 RepID=UPI001E334F42|nr:helix-turn-helix domain-containing protein [Pedobacter sp. MC2016-14]MCD0489941.1 helix-turn-helix domain-containing protein [Pedobacter sp. MC2016-14]
MANIIEIKTITEYNRLMDTKTSHPLLNVVDFSTLKPREKSTVSGTFTFSFYAVSIKYGKSCEMKYGRNNYDYQDGTLVFTAPNQVMNVEATEDFTPQGFALIFHPDLIRGTSLGQRVKDYSFFSYDVHEALHLNENELEVVLECFKKINFELQQTIDKHSRHLIVSNIELLLSYCVRFYDRQFITRDQINSDVLTRFESLLNSYFQSENPQQLGIPTVAYFASQLHLSANYFGDLVKKETGRTALEYVQLAIIEAAKEMIFIPGVTVNEVALELGFKYPQHFSRFFKKHVGHSPNEYRQLK